MLFTETKAADDGAPDASKFSFISFWAFFDGIGVFWLV
jgi:hypothetical protein